MKRLLMIHTHTFPISSISTENMDSSLLHLSILVIFLDMSSCQVGFLCPENDGPNQEPCEPSCLPGDEGSACPLGHFCCFVGCGHRCIKPEDYGGAVFKSHHPNYGPVSGDTVVALTGDFTKITQVSSAALKSTPGDPGTGVRSINQDITTAMDVYSRNSTHILLKTRAVKDIYEGLVFLIHIEYVSNGVFMSSTTDFDFTYRPDPIITALYPRAAAFISGGIALTAVGENLDSVANPVMLIHMERRRNFGNEYDVINVYTFRSEDTRVYNDTALVGITPLINTSATNTFRTGLKPDGNIGSFARRRRRQTATEASDPEIPINSETLEFFIGFELDGVTRFENLSRAIDAETGRLVVYQTPHIERYKETKKFNPNTETVLVIHGERLRLGATVSDYQIQMGGGTCVMAELNDNSVLCTPPEVEPDSSTGKHELRVSIGYFEFKVGQVEYEGQDTTVFIIIGCVVGAVILTAAVVGIAVLCCRKSGSTAK